MKMIHMTCPDHPEATLEGYILDCEISLGQDTNRPAIVVCPGGGYVYCSPREAEPIALRYAAQGFHAFILRYSVGFEAADFAPLQEVSWVIGLLRQHADLWHIDPDKIAVCGFSAGGHLALAAGLLAENKPNAMILGYPAVDLPNLPGVDYMLKLLSGKKEVSQEDSDRFSLSHQITREAPPVFIAATAEDFLTSYGALPVVNAYTKLGLGYEAHIFQHGPHGYSLADATSADGSEAMINEAFAQWHDLSISWLHRIFGAPEHIQKNASKMAGYIAKLGFTMPGQTPGHA